MRVEDAYTYVRNASNSNFGRFFSSGSSVGVGKGKIYSEALYPFFDIDESTYLTLSGMVYVLTHECDIEPENAKFANEDVLIAPIVPLESLVTSYSAQKAADQLIAFLSNLGARNISRLIYLPPIADKLPYGGVIFLNQITNCHISTLLEANSIATVTGFGLAEIEMILENHLLRPKAYRLAFVPEEVGNKTAQ
jgi:hypothetical protein